MINSKSRFWLLSSILFLPSVVLNQRKVKEKRRRRSKRLLIREARWAKLIRRLSLRPTPEELEDKNILKSELFCSCFTGGTYTCLVSETTNEEMRKEREEKKRYLLRKLSFRPTLDELKTKKVS